MTTTTETPTSGSVRPHNNNTSIGWWWWMDAMRMRKWIQGADEAHIHNARHKWGVKEGIMFLIRVGRSSSSPQSVSPCCVLSSSLPPTPTPIDFTNHAPCGILFEVIYTFPKDVWFMIISLYTLLTEQGEKRGCRLMIPARGELCLRL